MSENQRGYPLTKSDTTVLDLGHMAIEGNILPPQWLRHLTFENGKPYTIAAVLLSDVVYWYRPIWPRDEVTGQPLPPRKKFKADKIQRSYDAYVQMYGFTKGQVTEAFHYLEKQGLVNLNFRTINTPNGKLGNVLFIGLNIQRLAEITNTVPPIQLETDRGTDETGEGATSNGTGIMPKPETNTDTTTEISTHINGAGQKDYLDSILTGKTNGVSEYTAPNPIDQWAKYSKQTIQHYLDIFKIKLNEVSRGLLGNLSGVPGYTWESYDIYLQAYARKGINPYDVEKFCNGYQDFLQGKPVDQILNRIPVNGTNGDGNPVKRHKDGGWG